MTTTLKLPIEIVKLSEEAQADGYPFEAIILSGEPIDGWHRFIVDLSTMKYHKPRLTVNYNHNDSVIIGYGENFEVTPEGLKSTGKLVVGSFADELVSLAKQGVPFEASVEIDLDNAIETRVGADATTTVNGRTYQGPISVYQGVPLRAYAICPCGADKFTYLTLLQKERNLTMPKKPNTTKLSNDDKNPAPDPGAEVQATVKSQDLADLCSIFGNDTGVKLFQDGADVAEVRQWQALNEKYSQHLSSDDDDDEPTPPPAEDTQPTKDDDEDNKLSAVLTKLSGLETKLNAEITKLHAAIPKGAEPVSHNSEPSTAEPKAKNSVEAYAKKYKKQ